MANLSAYVIWPVLWLAVPGAVRAQAPAPLARAPAALASTDLPQLYNGPEYVDYAKRYHAQAGHQFFLSADKQPGTVYYNGRLFGPVQLAYDAVRDQVVLPQPTSPLSLRLLDARVRYFTIDGHYFRRVVADSAAGTGLRTGYYEVLVAEGAVQVLARQGTDLRERVTSAGIDAEFTPFTRLFVRKNGVYHAVGGKRALAGLLADQAEPVRRYIQAHALRFGKEALLPSVVELVTYYNSLALAR